MLLQHYVVMYLRAGLCDCLFVHGEFNLNSLCNAHYAQTKMHVRFHREAPMDPMRRLREYAATRR
jgi:hypothetical protein